MNLFMTIGLRLIIAYVISPLPMVPPGPRRSVVTAILLLLTAADLIQLLGNWGATSRWKLTKGTILLGNIGLLLIWWINVGLPVQLFTSTMVAILIGQVIFDLSASWEDSHPTTDLITSQEGGDSASS